MDSNVNIPPRKKKVYTAAMRAANKRWSAKNRARLEILNRNSLLKRKYGITQAQYEEMVKKQNGRCAICKTDKPGGAGKKLHVDHEHGTKRVRGLLCVSCNLILGYAHGSTKTLLAAFDYLYYDAEKQKPYNQPYRGSGV